MLLDQLLLTFQLPFPPPPSQLWLVARTIEGSTERQAPVRMPSPMMRRVKFIVTSWSISRGHAVLSGVPGHGLSLCWLGLSV